MPDEPKTIIVEGDEQRERSYQAIKDTVVFITNRWYYKHDSDRVVPIKRDGKVRFYRKNSPLICTDLETGATLLKAECFLTDDGIYLNKQSENVVKIGEKYYRKAYCVTIGGQNYLKTDPSLAKCPKSGRLYVRGKGVKVSKKWYGVDELAGGVTKVLKDGEIVLQEDTFEYFDTASASLVLIHRNDQDRNYGYHNILYDFTDKTNPQEGRLVSKIAPAVEVNNGLKDGTYLHITFPNGVQSITHKSLKEYFDNAIETYIKPRYMTKLDEARKSINKNYSDLDDKENVAKEFEIIPEPFGGKVAIVRTQSHGKPVLSKTYKETGGLKYSFGLEFETSQGLVRDKKILEELGLLVVGDRSVGAGEYVTSPMKGDKGVQILEEICDLLNKKTLVDDRCGLHVHVGSLFQPKEPGDLPKAKEAPSFSDDFLINSINLGAGLEEELYKSLPPNRSPILYHCHSIKRYAPINKQNFAKIMGPYCYGPREWWLKPTDQCPEQLFDFSKYELGKDRNRRTAVGQWAGGRYKWLNLIPSYCSSPHRTIEFRIFNGTTVFEKVKAFLLTSMAFTYVADNRAELCKPGTTLSQVFDAAFPKDPEIVKFLNDFYEMRKEKFNRRQIYPKLDLPFLK